MLAISTLTSEINFYSRLMKLRDSATGKAIFTILQIQLACQKCIDDGKSAECVHMLHLAPRWQSTERHRRLKTIMQDRPDLIQSELAGLAFDSLQQAFAGADIERMFQQEAPPAMYSQPVYIIIDPAAGGPQSEYAVISMTRHKGLVTVIGIDVLAGCKDPTKQFNLVREHVGRLRENLMWARSAVTFLVERNLGFEARASVMVHRSEAEITSGTVFASTAYTTHSRFEVNERASDASERSPALRVFHVCQSCGSMAEHHERELSDMDGVRFFRELGNERSGVLTTNDTKHQMCGLTNSMMREGRMHVLQRVLSRDPVAMRQRLKDQLGIYSYQFKSAATTFNKDQSALNGKVGGMKDDLCICLQIGVMYTSPGSLLMRDDFI